MRAAARPPVADLVPLAMHWRPDLVVVHEPAGAIAAVCAGVPARPARCRLVARGSVNATASPRYRVNARIPAAATSS